MSSPYQKIIDLLNQNQLHYELIEHKAVHTSQQAAKVRGLSAKQGAKSLLLKSPLGFMLVILPGNKKINSAKLRNYLGVRKVHFASPAEVEEVMGCTIGACYPFGNLINVRTVVDRSLAANRVISFSVGEHTKSIKMAYADYLKLVQPELADLTAD